jgi:hypothetical protein
MGAPREQGCLHGPSIRRNSRQTISSKKQNATCSCGLEDP